LGLSTHEDLIRYALQRGSLVGGGRAEACQEIQKHIGKLK